VTVSETDLKSLEDARRQLREREDQRARDDRVQRWTQVAKRITWMVLIAAAFLVYYLFDKLSEALSLLK
jgi:hypothetical protein